MASDIDVTEDAAVSEEFTNIEADIDANDAPFEEEDSGGSEDGHEDGMHVVSTDGNGDVVEEEVAE
jgi:hypothetical protein